LREILGQDVDIQTANYSLNNNYSQGYVVNNTLVVKVHDPANIGKVIDAVTKSGANVIGGLESSAAQDQAARSEALQQATAQALVNAKAMAAGLGLRFVRVVLAEPSLPRRFPIQLVCAANRLSNTCASSILRRPSRPARTIFAFRWWSRSR
jgi:uncharacterized protein YggE